MTQEYPIAVIGAGPVGLAAGAHLVQRGLAVTVLEAGPAVGHTIRDWGHVKLFSVWSQCIDDAARQLLQRAGWAGVPEDQLPTGIDLVRDYLVPLAATPELSRVIETDSRVVRIVRQGLDRLSSKRRDDRPFVITVENAAGARRKIEARAIIDTSGTWQNPNPIGADGWPAEGEEEGRDRIFYGIPDVAGANRAHYAGKRTAVIGAGHSAANALLDLALLADEVPETSMTWIVRGQSLSTVFGGGEADRLPARGVLGHRLKRLADTGRLAIVTGFAAEKLTRTADGLVISGSKGSAAETLGPFDRIIAATGQRPDFTFARELHLDLHPAVESTRMLGPLIDPNLHSCGTVPPHGWRELAHPEKDVFVAGIKSYGRAPTFLLLTGYEQVRSIVAHLAGDNAAADEVKLVLPETGICSATLEQVAPGGEACCAGAAANAAEPCCEKAKTLRAAVCCGQAPATDDGQRAAACCG